jgi:DnaJ-class molecular chaperone
MPGKKDYYDILNVDQTATLAEIKKSYKKLITKYHPDKNQKNPSDAEEKSKDINEAYNILSDEKKRQNYDKYGDPEGLNNSNNTSNANNTRSTGEDKTQTHEELIKDMMKTMAGLTSGMGIDMNNLDDSDDDDEIEDVVAYYDITLESVYHLKHKLITTRIARHSVCTLCNTNGTKDGKKHRCFRCGGSGSVVKLVNKAGIVQSDEDDCEDCNGTGVDKKAKLCPDCEGYGGVEEECDLEFKLIGGMYNNYQVRILNQGNEIPDRNGRRSNLVLVIREKPHPIFKRMFVLPGKRNPDPADLLMDLDISLAESICGFQRTIKHVNNTDIEIYNYDKILKHGDVLVLQGKGMPVMNQDKFGDLYISIKVIYPDEMDRATKNKIWLLLTKTAATNIKKNKDNLQPLETFRKDPLRLSNYPPHNFIRTTY